METSVSLLERLAGAPTDDDGRRVDVKTVKELGRVEGHTGRVQSVTFSPDDGRALSAGEDGTVRLWDVSTGHELHRLARH
jgi:WD40 repeat protein